MDVFQDTLKMIDQPLVAGAPMSVFLSSCIVIMVTLAIATAVKNFSPVRMIPIALSDQFLDRKKRIDQYRVNSREILIQTYKKFKDQIFGIDTSEGLIFVLPPRFIDELKSHPSLSFSGTFDSLTLPEYTRIKPTPSDVIKLFTGKLNPKLGDLMPQQQQLFKTELLKEIPADKEWKPVKIYPIVFRLACKSAARALLDEEAANNDRWIELEEQYISTAIPYIQRLKQWPKMLRPFVYRHVEGYKTLTQQWAEGQAVISGSLERLKQCNWKPRQNPASLFELICSESKEMSIDDHLSLQITLFIAGVHTSAATTTQAIFDAAVNIACIDEVRQEILEMSSKCGGVFTRQNLGKLVKLDSFIKEVLRFSSPDLVTFVRKSSKEVVLSDGFCIPKGAKLQVATGAIGMDEELFQNPKTFDGLRFWRLRQQKDEEMKHQFTSVGKRDLDWGYGRHACPGRYMADITIKLLIVEILLHFEIKNRPGTDRHANIEFDGQTMPDTEAEVLMRRI